MSKKIFFLAATIFLAATAGAHSAAFSTTITDSSGKAVVNAVVVLVPEQKAAMPAPDTRLAADKTVDQRDEQFLPMVTIVPRGGRIKFTNNDNTMHQVYSFSSVKQFEFTLAHGQVSPPVAFDKAGIAAIGCNIHDHMVAFAFVADSPWAVLTDASGKAQIAGVPPGNYTAQIWHNRLPPGAPWPTARVEIGTGPASLTTKINTRAEPNVLRRHGGSY